MPPTAPAPIAPIEYRPSRTRMVVMAAILFLFDVGYVWMLTNPKGKADDRVFGLVGLILFGVGFVAALLPTIRPRALLRLDAEGVTEWGHFGGENVRLPWSNVLRVDTFRWKLIPVLSLVPLDAERALADASPSMAKAAKGNRRTYGHPFVIDARMYCVKTDEVAAEIERRLAAVPSPTAAYPRPEGRASGNVPGRF